MSNHPSIDSIIGNAGELLGYGGVGRSIVVAQTNKATAVNESFSEGESICDAICKDIMAIGSFDLSKIANQSSNEDSRTNSERALESYDEIVDAICNDILAIGELDISSIHDAPDQ